MDHELKMSIRKSTSELLEEKRSVNNSTNDENEVNHSESKRKFYGESGTSSRHEHSSIVEDTKNKILEQIERDTSVTADQSIKDLISEIKESEVLVANQKLHYNEMVSEYNKAIYSLPLAFLRTTIGLFEKEYL